MNHSPWRSLEAIPGFSALPAVWRRHLGDDFETFRAAFLQKKATTVRSFPCPRNCGCAHCVICELALRLQKPFILFAPTSDHLDAACHELLGLARAAFFALDGHVRLTFQGALYPAKAPGAMFGQFTPPPKESRAEDTTRKAF